MGGLPLVLQLLVRDRHLGVRFVGFGGRVACTVGDDVFLSPLLASPFAKPRLTSRPTLDRRERTRDRRSYYPYYCKHWNYGYGYGYGATKAAASGSVEAPKTVTAADAAARAAETRARREGLTETARSDAEIESGVSNERLAVESRARERASERASAERAGVAAGCGDWLGVTPEQLAGAPANVAVVDDACCWPSGCALAASTECEDEGRACCAPDSERVEGCE